MTILSCIQDAADELAGVARPTAAVASTERETQRLLRYAYATGDDIVSQYDHPTTIRRGTFTLADATSTYAIPSDFKRWIYNTHWDATNHWMLLGPYSPQEWEALQNGVSVTLPRKAFRVWERGSRQFEVSPTPSASDAGTFIYFEYISGTWLMPTAWTALTDITVGEYRSYNGNIYICTVAGTTSAGSPPTVTTGTVTEGTVTWSYVSDTYNRAVADSDTSLISEDIITLGIIWRYLRAIGNDYSSQLEEYDRQVQLMIAGYTGARTLDFNNVRLPIMIGPWNIPDTFT